MSATRICLDTNVWVNGILGLSPLCQVILSRLDLFEVELPDIIRDELQRNLREPDMRRLFRIANGAGVISTYEDPPADLVTKSVRLGLKKGDAVIAAYCEWRRIATLVSDNRHFLRELQSRVAFIVISPWEFCERNIKAKSDDK